MNTPETVAIRKCPFHASAQINQQAANFDMFDAGYQTSPTESLKQFQQEKPIFFSQAMNYWVVTRYNDIKEIFRDPVLFSARNVLEKFTPNSKEADNVLKSYNYAMNKTLVNEDEPIHTERRRELLEAFTAPNLEELRETTRALVKKQVDSFINDGKVEVLSTILWEVPLVIALKFLGVPDDDITELQKYGVAHKVNTWGKPSPEEQVHVATMVGKFWYFSGQVLQRMKENVGDKKGWMYDMIRKNHTNPRVVTDNYLHSMMMAILVAAHETTSTSTANAIVHLLSTPGLWKKLHDNPHMIPAAVEECLRYAGPIVAWRREATADTEVAGVKIAKGDKLFLVMASANRDPEHFENPDLLDIQRDNASEHLSFGYGAHQCLGKNIGRMEMCVIIEELTRRIPYLQLPEQKFTNLPNTSFHGPEELWLRWDTNKIVPDQLQHSVFPIGNPDKKQIYRNTSVVSIKQLTNNVKEITLQTDDSVLPLPTWSPGAHIELLLPNGLTRKYSLCPSNNDQHYVIAVQREDHGGGGSLWIHENLSVGDTVKLRGPKNFFKLNLQASDYLLIAGGIGISPIFSMANALNKAKKSYSFVYCGQNKNNMAYLTELYSSSSNLQVCISSEGSRANLDTLLKSQKPDTHIYACGPERMLDELDFLANKYGLNLTFELFSSVSSILNPELENSFEVELTNTGKTYHIPRNKTVLEVLLENDVDVPNDCEEGLCGSCEVVVEAGDIDHRDKVLSASERANNKLMITCCSRAKGKIRITL